ncbi:hypothetical protein [Thermococcus sp.]|uniref:hypothetical protein n=1 Tax=Thermococcus sp. TaxID=35749 RepID=UPI002602EA70|nr:hypothetical protein [Thermococcus sp.]
MEEHNLLRILYGLFLGGFLIIAGLITFTARDEPGIGFRIGYTYLSDRARRKANFIAGVGTLITGFLLIVLSPFLPWMWLMIALLAGLGITLFLAYSIARHEYELEELSKSAPDKPGRRIEPPKVEKYVVLQLTFLTVSLVLFVERLGEGSGVEMMVVVQLFLLVLTIFASQPVVFQLAPKFRGKMAVGFAGAITIVSGTMTLQLAVMALKPNMSPLTGILLLFVSLGSIFYAVFISLTSAYEEGYY